MRLSAGRCEPGFWGHRWRGVGRHPAEHCTIARKDPGDTETKLDSPPPGGDGLTEPLAYGEAFRTRSLDQLSRASSAL